MGSGHTKGSEMMILPGYGTIYITHTYSDHRGYGYPIFHISSDPKDMVPLVFEETFKKCAVEVSRGKPMFISEDLASDLSPYDSLLQLLLKKKGREGMNYEVKKIYQSGDSIDTQTLQPSANGLNITFSGKVRSTLKNIAFVNKYTFVMFFRVDHLDITGIHY